MSETGEVPAEIVVKVNAGAQNPTPPSDSEYSGPSAEATTANTDATAETDEPDDLEMTVVMRELTNPEAISAERREIEVQQLSHAMIVAEGAQLHARLQKSTNLEQDWQKLTDDERELYSFFLIARRRSENRTSDIPLADSPTRLRYENGVYHPTHADDETAYAIQNIGHEKQTEERNGQQVVLIKCELSGKGEEWIEIDQILNARMLGNPELYRKVTQNGTPEQQAIMDAQIARLNGKPVEVTDEQILAAGQTNRVSSLALLEYAETNAQRLGIENIDALRTRLLAKNLADAQDVVAVFAGLTQPEQWGEALADMREVLGSDFDMSRMEELFRNFFIHLQNGEISGITGAELDDVIRTVDFNKVLDKLIEQYHIEPGSERDQDLRKILTNAGAIAGGGAAMVVLILIMEAFKGQTP